MVFWGDLYDDFLDHSGLRSDNGAGDVVRFLVCGRRWVRAVVGTSRSVRWRGSQCGSARGHGEHLGKTLGVAGPQIVDS